MANIGTASVRVEADTKGANRELRAYVNEFKREMGKVDRQRATARIEANLRPLKQDIAEAQLMLRSLRDQKVQIKAEGGPEAERVIRAINVQTAALNRQITALKQQELIEQTEINRLKAAHREVDRLNREETALIKTQEKLSLASEKHGVEVARLRNQYVALRSEINKSERSVRFFTDRVEQIRLGQTQAELDLVRKRLKEMGEETNDLDHIINRHDGTLRRWASNLSDIRVHLGLVSLNLKQLAIVGGAGANLISGLAGSFSSLISVTGAALYGGIGLTTSALASFGLVTAGIVGIMKPLIADFGNAKKAIDAYDDAVLKYGKNSTQAQGKMEQMERVIGSLNAKQREAISSVQQLGDRWNRLTASARPAFFRTAAEGIETLNELMPMLARESVSAFEAASRGTEKWFKGLRSAEAENIIETMMSNATDAIGPLSNALGDLVTWFGRIAASFSRAFEPIARGFENWTQGLADGVANTKQLDQDVDSLLDKLKTFGDFLTTGVSLIHNFFAAGVGEGQAFMETITNTLDRWNEWVKSAEGRNSIAEWMNRGIEITREFWNALSALAKALASLGPVTRVAFEAIVAALTVLGKLTSFMTSIPGMTSALRGFAAAWLAFKALSGVAGILTGLSTAMGTFVLRAQMTGAVGGAIAGTAGVLARFGRVLPVVGSAIALGVGLFADFGGGADEAAASVQHLSDTVTSLKTALDGLNSADADFIDARAAHQAALETEAGLQRKLNGLVDDGKKGTKQYDAVLAELEAAQSNRIRTQQQLRASIKTFVDGQKAATHAIRESQGFTERLGIAEGDRAAAVPKLISLLKNKEAAFSQGADAIRKHNDALRELGVSDQEIAKFNEASKEQIDGWIEILKAGENGTKKFIRSLTTAATGFEGAGAKAQATRQKMEGLFQLLGDDLAPILLKVEDRDAARKIVNLLDKARELGATPTELKFLASDKPTAAKIRRLKGLLDSLKQGVEFPIDADADDAERDLNNVESFNISGKNVVIDGDRSAFDAVVNSIPDVVGTATMVIRGLFSGPFGSPKKGGAEGLAIGAAQGISDRQVAQAMQSAGKRMPRQLDRSRLINKPTLLTGEEAPQHPEFVIATNPAYRQRNLGFLAQAAQALGVPLMGFKKGGKVPKKFRVGAVPEERAAGQFQSAQTKYQNVKQRVQDLERDQRDAQKAGEPFKKGPQLTAARKRLPEVTEKRNEWRRRYDAVRSVNKKISFHESSINRSGTQMDLAQQKGKRNEFNRWRDVRKKQLGKLRDVLTKAAGSAGSYPEFKQQLKERIAATKLEMRQLPIFESAGPGTVLDWLAQTKGKGKNLKDLLHREVLATETASPLDDIQAVERTLAFLSGLNRKNMPREVVEDLIGMIVDRRDQLKSLKSGGAISLEDLLTETEAGQLDTLRRAEVLASVTPDTGDDEAARRASLPFFEALFQRLSSSGAPTDVLEQVASEITSRRGSISGAPSLGEQFFSLNKERYNLFRNFSSNFIPAPTASQYANPASYAGGNRGPAGGSQVNITNNYQEPPPDPHTWSKQQEYEVRAATA